MKLDLQRIRIEQARQCLSVVDLSKETGLVRTTVSNVLNGKITPTPKTLGLIAKALKVDVEDIILKE